jgi:tripartite-type tricarboxylate transporter receptor subunit TctC
VRSCGSTARSALKLFAAPALLAGLAAPAGTPDAVVTRWNELVNEALRDPTVHEQVGALDYDIRGGTAQEFTDFFTSDMSRYKKLAEDMGLSED